MFTHNAMYKGTPMTAPSLKLYSFPLSGHAHRARLALSLLGLKADIHDIDLANGEQNSAWFKKLNPAGLVPVLIDGDTVISESTAILTYLGKKFDDGTLFPGDAKGAALVEKYFVSASTGLAAGPARARLINLFGAQYDKDETVANAHAYLADLNTQLAGKDYLVANRFTFADVAIYSYVAHAPEGDVSLEAYPNITAWIARVEAQDKFVAMPKPPAAAA
jgi:glutathione S-transferase